MQPQEPQPANNAWREAAGTVCAAVLVVLFGLVLLARDPYAFWHDDFQSYHLPGYRDVARAWRAGEFPLLSPYSWIGGALAGEYQYGVFSVFLTACVVSVFAFDLPLTHTAAVLALLHLAVLAAGAFRLGRVRGMGPPAALVVALTAALNGWIIVWGARAWFPGVASCAWLPWFWWALERATQRHGLTHFVPAGLFFYLILTAGWPFTVLMAGLLSLWFALTMWFRQGVSPTLALLGGAWLLGLALSAPAWLMLLEYTPHTLRDKLPGEASLQWRVPLAALPSLIFPAWVSEWSVYGTTKDHPGIELAGGLVPLVLILAAWRRHGVPFLRRHGRELLLAALVLELTLLPGLGAFRWSFRWLPLFFLALGVTAGHALEELTRPEPIRPPPLAGLYCLFLVLLAALPALISGMGPAEHVRWQALGLTVLALAWFVVDRRRQLAAVRLWMPSAVLLGSVGLAYWDATRFADTISWKEGQDLGRLEPLDPARRYFTVHEMRDIYDWEEPPGVERWVRGRGEALRPGNTWMLLGVESVNGYSPMVPAVHHDVFRFMSYAQSVEADAEQILQRWSGPQGMLAFAGVGGLIVADRFAEGTGDLARKGWTMAARVEGATVYHREGPPAPRVRSVAAVLVVEERTAALRHLREEKEAHTPVLVRRETDETGPRSFAVARLDVLYNGRNRVTVAVANPSTTEEALVVFLRPWYPGYRAYLDGAPLPVETVDLTMPAVRVPPGARGQLVLEYRPRSLVLGCWLAGAALAGLGFFGVRRFSAAFFRSKKESKESGGKAPHSKETGLTVGAALVVVGFGLALLLLDPGFFFYDDNQIQHLPARYDVVRAWRAGEVPLLSPYSWHCAALAGEYQYAVFSIFEAVCVTLVCSLGLSLTTTGTVLVLLHLAVLAAGAFRLARGRGLSAELALFVALAASLNGYVLNVLGRSWFPGLATLAWLPWFWWALERAVGPASRAGPGWPVPLGSRDLPRFVPAAVFLYLILTGGWPFTVAMSAWLSLWFVVSHLRSPHFRTAFWLVSAAWLGGLALSAPAWLMLLEYGKHTLRASMLVEISFDHCVPLAGLPGLIFPAWTCGTNADPAPQQMMLYLIGGVTPIIVLLTAGWRLGRAFLHTHRAEVYLVLVTLFLAMLPSTSNLLRWSYRWLPLFFLALGLLAAQAVAALRRAEPDRGLNLGAWAIALVVPTAVLAWLGRPEFRDVILPHALALLGVAVVWALIEWRSPAWRGAALCGVALASCGLAYRDLSRFLPFAAWDCEAIRTPAPLDTERLWFSVHDVADMVQTQTERGLIRHRGAGVGLRPGNGALYAGVRAVNGYTPMIPPDLYSVFRFIALQQRPPEDAALILREWSGPEGFLRFVGVDGLIVSDQFAPQADRLESHGWVRAARVENGDVYHRQGPLAPRCRSVSSAEVVENADTLLDRLRQEAGSHVPRLLPREGEACGPRQFAVAQIGEVQDGRNSVAVEVSNPAAEQEALLVFLRPWVVGYRASLDGKPLPVEIVDRVLPAVRLPPGARGRLLLEYRPAGLVVGCWLAGAALLGIVVSVGRLATLRRSVAAGPDASAKRR